MQHPRIPKLVDLAVSLVPCLCARELYKVFTRNDLPVDWLLLKKVLDTHDRGHRRSLGIRPLQMLAASAIDNEDIKCYSSWCLDLNHPSDYSVLISIYHNWIKDATVNIDRVPHVDVVCVNFHSYFPESHTIKIRVSTAPGYEHYYIISDIIEIHLDKFNERDTKVIVISSVSASGRIPMTNNVLSCSLSRRNGTYKLNYGNRLEFLPKYMKKAIVSRIRMNLEFTKEKLMTWLHFYCTTHRVDYSSVPEDFRFTTT